MNAVRVAGRVLRAAAGLVAGALTAVVTGVALLATAPAWAFRTPPRPVAAAARRLTGLERRRLRTFLDADDAGAAYGDQRALSYLAARVPLGLLGGMLLALLGWGAATAGWTLGRWAAGGAPDGIAPTAPVVTYLLAAGGVMAFLVVSGLTAVVRAERTLARRLLGPDDHEVMRRRIAELAASRAGIVAAVDTERRRIERDLHDGLQQRLVALGMLLGRARHTGAADLVEQAHEETQRALAELQEVAWRVYPSTLDELGLAEALDAVADRSPIPVRLTYALPGRPAPPVETAVYFTVREAVTNAAKHSGATAVTVEVGAAGGRLRVRVGDDGKGGADPDGHGLVGLRRRVEALDGRFTVSSPSGGPTVVEAELPCA